MAITAAAIEPNGWVLAITHTAGLGSFASYTLDPDGTPRATLSSLHPGFDVASGIAVANPAKARSLVATKPVRKPAVVANDGTVGPEIIDETDLGGGSTRVRIALSNWVYATDSALSLTVAAGWRTGEAAATVAVTNGSTVACPAPIHRWADVPYQRQAGPFDLELLAFGFGPQGNQPVAGVKFTVTDGTTVKTVWTTALSTSARYGDNLRCHRVTVDPAGLNAGLLRCDAEVYPWLGAMRPTDVAGTRSMAGLNTSAYAGGAQIPFVVAYDPARSRYGIRTVYIDYASGTTTASAAMVASGATDAAALTAAKAVAPAARAKDITTAIQALYLDNRSLAAANGQGGQAHALDGARLVLAPGVHAGGFGSTPVTYLPTSLESWVTVEGDPGDANPRGNCVLRSVGDGDTRTTRLAFRNLTIEAGAVLSYWPPYWWFDNVEIRGKAGFETANTVLVGSGNAGDLGVHVTNSKLWKTGIGFDNSFGGRAKLIRASQFRRSADAPVVVTSRVIPEAEDSSFTGVLGSHAVGAHNYLNDAPSVYDSIAAYNDIRATRERFWVRGKMPASVVGTARDQVLRQVCFGNICERIGSSPDCGLSIGEGDYTDTADIIIEGNSFVGARANLLYNNPGLGADVATTDGLDSRLVNTRLANNAFDWHPTKHDRFDDPNVKAQRVAAGDVRQHGVRPTLQGSFAALYSVGAAGNINLYRDVVRASLFVHAYEGLRCRYDAAPIDPLYAADNSYLKGAVANPALTGLGDYTPAAGSPLLARGVASNSDRDRAGTVRAARLAAGAIEPVAVAAPTQLAPNGARSPSLAGAVLLGWSTIVVAAGALQPTRATAATLTFTAPAGGKAVQLLPDVATHPLRDALGIVLQPGGGSASIRTIVVPDDFRVHEITLS